MHSIEAVDQDGTKLHWIAKVRGKREGWDAEITDQTPDRSVAWRSTAGAHTSGSVKFAPHEGGTHVYVTIEVERNPLEAVGDTLTHAVAHDIEQDLENFKRFAELGEPVIDQRGEDLDNSIKGSRCRGRAAVPHRAGPKARAQPTKPFQG